MQHLYPYGIFRVDTVPTAKVAYLTFDDGPIPEVTPKVLEILARYDVKATFFMVGENIDKYPEVFAQVVSAGHRVANHTYNHMKGFDYSLDEYLANVAQCQQTLDNHQSPITNHQLFRPPYGKATLAQRRALSRMGYEIIYWDVLTRDYNNKITPARMMKTIQRQTRRGSIINFHDSLKSNERMLAVLPEVIEWLLSQGYQLKTL